MSNIAQLLPMMSPPNNASYAATFLDQPQACGSGIRVGVAMVLRKESVLLNLAQIGAPKVMALNNCCFPILMFDIIILPYIYNWNPRCFLGLLSFSASRRTSTSMIWSTPWWNTLLARVTYHRFFQRTVGKEQYHLRFVLQNLWISTLRPAWRYLLTLDMWFIHMDLNYCRLHALACKGWQFFLLYRALRAPSIWWRLCVHLGQEYQEGLPCERRWMCLVIWAGTLLLQQTWWFQGAKTEI